MLNEHTLTLTLTNKIAKEHTLMVYILINPYCILLFLKHHASFAAFALWFSHAGLLGQSLLPGWPVFGP
jgi:hypothetical protein